MKITPPKRTTDKWGSGAYLASRGDRVHHGIDYAVYPESLVYSPVGGQVTKIGLPYADSHYRYVQITFDGENHRVFYIEPMVKVGDKVTTSTVIGKAQDLGPRYPGITPHIHYEVKLGDIFRDPEA